MPTYRVSGDVIYRSAFVEEVEANNAEVAIREASAAVSKPLQITDEGYVAPHVEIDNVEEVN